MKMRYFVVDRAGRLRKASQAWVQGLWEGRRRAGRPPLRATNELRLVSVACDDDLVPSRVYLLRLPLTGGRFGVAEQLTLRLYTMRDCVTAEEAVRHHGGGWPLDLARQLAVALDVPVARLGSPFAVGGPLLTAAARRVTPRQAARYLA